MGALLHEMASVCGETAIPMPPAHVLVTVCFSSPLERHAQLDAMSLATLALVARRLQDTKGTGEMVELVRGLGALLALHGVPVDEIVGWRTP